jgi:hypothetical protein
MNAFEIDIKKTGTTGNGRHGQIEREGRGLRNAG